MAACGSRKTLLCEVGAGSIPVTFFLANASDRERYSEVVILCFSCSDSPALLVLELIKFSLTVLNEVLDRRPKVMDHCNEYFNVF